jgi:hypothetical protein
VFSPTEKAATGKFQSVVVDLSINVRLVVSYAFAVVKQTVDMGGRDARHISQG